MTGPQNPGHSGVEGPYARPTAAASKDLIVVEDDPAMLAMLVLQLEAAGYKVKGFSQPIDGLMWAADAEPACIVVDLRLPGVEGLDLVAAFAALKRHPVIILSANASVGIAVDAMRMGVHDVLEKPVSNDRLLESIRSALAAHPAPDPSDEVVFTRRERQVAELLLTGLTSKQIAQALELSPRTVEFFRASLLRKTQSRTTAALALALARLGFS